MLIHETLNEEKRHASVRRAVSWGASTTPKPVHCGQTSVPWIHTTRLTDKYDLHSGRKSRNPGSASLIGNLGGWTISNLIIYGLWGWRENLRDSTDRVYWQRVVGIIFF